MSKAVQRTGQGAGATPKPKRGKGSAVLIRVTQETRDALEREAAKTGRSLSQTAEIWLDEASRGQAEYLDRMGGDERVAAALRMLARIATAIGAQFEDPYVAYRATRKAWAIAAEAALPLPQPAPTDLLADALELDGIWTACEAVRAALERAPPEDPVVVRSRQGAPTGLVADPTLSIVDALRPDPDFQRPLASLPAALRELRKSGDTAAIEIDTAITRADAYFGRIERNWQKVVEAEKLAETIARAAMSLGLPQREPS